MLVIGTAVAVVAGCGSGKQSVPPPPASQPAATTMQTTAPAPNALQAEAGSAATGDIPDNQVFLVFRNRVAGYSMKYPEGWAQQGAARTVTFRDKNNIVRVLIANGSVSVASVQHALKTLKGVAISRQPQALTIGSSPAVKLVYTTKSAPNAVTGKRVTLTVDRYYLGNAGKEAI